MSLVTTIGESQQDMKSSTYCSEYLKWKGRIADVPLLQEMLTATVDAVCNSYKITGSNSSKAKKTLLGMRGYGKETFKLMMKNLTKVAMIGGDAYAEYIYDADDNLSDLNILPADNITQVIENGRIVRYEENNGTGKWNANELLHLPFNPTGAVSHGSSCIEPLNNLILDWLQLMDDYSKTFHKYAKPWYLFEVDSDDTGELQKVKDKIVDLNKTSDGDLFIPKGTVTVTRHGIPQFATLDPTAFNRIILDQFFMSMRMSEQLMGAGSVNSEESARMQMTGFLQKVKSMQEWLAEHIESQIFTKMFGDRIPNIKWSYAVEPDEDKYKRMMDMFVAINNSQINDELKGALLIKQLNDMQVVERV